MSGPIEELSEQIEFGADDMPENPGPALLDREPVVGGDRRKEAVSEIRRRLNR